jgi:tetratricopeptide (TPR) repeat protein
MSSILSKRIADAVFVASSFVLISVGLLPASHAEPPPAASAEDRASTKPATGDARARAKRLFEQGQAHYDLGEYDEAIAAFREAYELSSAPALLFNIAQSHRLKGDCRRALQVYRHFVRLDPNSRERADAEAHIAKLVPSCEHAAEPAPATSSSAKVEDAAPPKNEPDATKRTAVDVPRLVETPVERVDTTGPTLRTQRQLVVGLLSTGLALAGVATALHVWNDTRFDDWRREDRVLFAAGGNGNLGELQRRQAANNDLLTSIRRVDTISLSVFVAAGASIAAGGVVLVAWQPPASSGKSADLQVSWTGKW